MDYAGYIDVPGRPLSDDPECELFDPVETYLASHHKLFLEAMDEVSRTRYGRLMIMASPGSAKSTYASVVFPSRYLGSNPGKRLILASYGAELAQKMGRRTRSILRQPRYERLFNCTLSPDYQAADKFSLTNGSEYMAAGILTGLTGNRADGCVIDDPLRGREDAESETIRSKTWDAYENDLLTRLVPGGWLVLILTRWHHEDLAGKILPSDWDGESGLIECRDKKVWRVICLQGRCETNTDPLGRKVGEYFWPEWFDEKYWVQAQLNKYVWASLYQQRPRPLDGGFFTEDMFLVDGQPIDWPRGVDYVFAIIDTAMKTGKKRDGTAVTFFARSRFRDIAHPLTILDWDVRQIQAALLEDWLPWVFSRLEELAALCKARGGVSGVWVEDKNSGTVLIQQMQNKAAKLEAEGKYPIPVHAIESRLSQMGKNERAMNASGYILAGDVKITRHAFEKTVEFHERTANHLLKQVTGFDPSEPDQGEDDILDTLTYGCSLALGNPEGF